MDPPFLDGFLKELLQGCFLPIANTWKGCKKNWLNGEVKSKSQPFPWLYGYYLHPSIVVIIIITNG